MYNCITLLVPRGWPTAIYLVSLSLKCNCPVWNKISILHSLWGASSYTAIPRNRPRIFKGVQPCNFYILTSFRLKFFENITIQIPSYTNNATNTDRVYIINFKEPYVVWLLSVCELSLAFTFLWHPCKNEHVIRNSRDDAGGNNAFGRKWNHEIWLLRHYNGISKDVHWSMMNFEVYGIHTKYLPTRELPGWLGNGLLMRWHYLGYAHNAHFVPPLSYCVVIPTRHVYYKLNSLNMSDVDQALSRAKWFM